MAPFEWQTRWIVTQSGFSKAKAEEIMFFAKEEMEYDISEDEFRIASEVSEIFRNTRGKLLN